MPEKKKNKKWVILAIVAVILLSIGIYFVNAANNPPKYYKSGQAMKVEVYCNNTLNQTCIFGITGSAAEADNRTREWFIKDTRKLIAGPNTRGTPTNSNLPYISASSFDTNTRKKTDVGSGDSDKYIYARIYLTVTIPAHYKYSSQASSNIAGLFNVYQSSSDTGSLGHATSSHTAKLTLRYNIWNSGIVDDHLGVRHKGNAVLKLYFTRNSYTLSYNVNGGPTKINSKTIACGGSTTLPTPARKAYSKFEGWYTAASGGSLAGKAGNSYSLCSGNVTLYARWSDYYYMIHYDPGEGTGTIANQKVDMGGGNISLNNGSGFSRTDYTLSGWNTKSDGSGTQYAAAQGGLSPAIFSTTPKTTVTLYAIWMGDGYNIMYDSNGGSGSLPNQTVERNTVVSLTPYTGLTKKGYHFLGWNKEQFTNKVEFLDQAEVENLAGDEDKIILYAIWQKDGTGFIQRPLLDADMFYNTRSIVGGNGTTYDRNYIDSRMAHIDKSRDPGYFTKK